MKSFFSACSRAMALLSHTEVVYLLHTPLGAYQTCGGLTAKEVTCATAWLSA